MKRFRFTLLTICLVLAWLGYNDLKLLYLNPEPLPITAAELEQNGAPREWLKVTDAVFNLEEAINPTGQIDSFEAGPFFVPLESSTGKETISVVVETRRPEIVSLLKKYVLDFNSVEKQQEFLEENRPLFHPKVTVTGMVASWVTSTANRDKLLKLAKSANMPVSPDVIFISEGKEPGKFRGYFFAVISLLGIIKFISMTIKKESGLAIDLPEEK